MVSWTRFPLTLPASNRTKPRCPSRRLYTYYCHGYICQGYTAGGLGSYSPPPPPPYLPPFPHPGNPNQGLLTVRSQGKTYIGWLTSLHYCTLRSVPLLLGGHFATTVTASRRPAGARKRPLGRRTKLASDVSVDASVLASLRSPCLKQSLRK